MDNSFFVVVPFYCEEKLIVRTLDRLAAQTDRDFSLVLVDNASTDGSLALVEEWRRRHLDMSVHIIREPQKGAGAASDTGFRYAIERGAQLIARTDADCLPAFDWVARIKAAFAPGKIELLAGQMRPRADEAYLSRFERFIIPFLLDFGEWFCRVTRRDKQYKAPFILLSGNNMAITSRMYLRAGGFPRISFEEEYEDRLLSEAVRRLTCRVAKRNDVVVYSSARRLKHYGYIKTVLWYDRKYKVPIVDVR